jgi:lysophospholipase L1-like esterase
MMELAKEYGAGVWDLYGVMGGANSVHTWLKEDLMKKDKLHFTTKGYQLIGDLLFEAIMNDWQNSTRQ